MKKYLRQLIWLVTLLTVSSPAWAIPGVGAIFTAIFSAFSAVSAFVTTLGFVGQFLVGYLAQQFLGFLGTSKPDLNNQQSAEQQAQGVQVQRKGSVEQIPVVYGKRKIAGVITFATTGGDSNKYLWVCYTFCEGPIEGLKKIYIDDWDLDQDAPASSDPNTYGYMEEKLNADQVDVSWGKYKSRVKLYFSKGNYVSDPSTLTNTLVNSKILGSGKVFEGIPSDKYKTTMVHNGLVTVWARYEWFKITTQAEADANPFSGSIPVIHLEILGRKIQPLWIGSSLTSQVKDTKVLATSTDAYGSGTLYYSTNPAEILLDYLRNPRYGKGLSVDDIHWDSWYKAAKKCNQLVASSSSGQTQPILSFNGVIPTDATLMNNIKIILQNMRAYMPYIQGKFKLKIEDAGNEDDILSGVATIKRVFTPNNIIGDITYSGIERSVKYNQVSLQYVEPSQKYTNQTVVYPETEDERQTYINQDGGREYKLDITFPGITSADIARDMAKLLFNKSRYQETCSLKVTSEAFDLELGDCIYIQSKILNFTTIPWRIVSKKINADYSVSLECVRNPDTIYPWTTPNQPDIVLPAYVPKGANRDAPPSQSLYPIGIVPPTRVYHGVIDPIINPGGSNVANSNNSYGGGGTTITSYALNDTVTFVGDPIAEYQGGFWYARVSYNVPNNPLFAGVTIAYYQENTLTETVNTSMYGFTNVSGGALNSLVTLDNTTNPGPGKTTSVVIGPFSKVGTAGIEMRARVFYSSGEYSSADTVIVIPFPTTTTSASPTIPTGTAITTIIDSSTVRAVGVPKYQPTESTRSLWKDAQFGSYLNKESSGAWVSGGMVDEEGELALWLNVEGLESGDRVVGVNFYFKRPNQTTYYKQTLLDPNWLSQSLGRGEKSDFYVGNSSVFWMDSLVYSASRTSRNLMAIVRLSDHEFNQADLLGMRGGDGGSQLSPYSLKSVDCIMRLVYRNGTESAYQHKFTFTYPLPDYNVNLVDPIRGLNYTIAGGLTTVGTNRWSDPTPTWQDTTTKTYATSAPPQLALYSGGNKMPALNANGTSYSGETITKFSNLSKRYIRMGVAGVYDGGGSTTASITLKLYPPNTTATGNGITGGTGSDRSYWRGTKVSYRAVRPGFTVPWTTITDKNITVDANGQVSITLTTGIFYDQLYEIVVTPQILDASQFGYTATNTTTAQDAYYSLYGVGFVNNVSGDGYPTGGNWNWAFNWNMLRTSYALQSWESDLPPMNNVLAYPTYNAILGTGYFPQIVKFNTRCVNKDITRALDSPNVKDVGTGWELNFYHQVQLYVGHIPNFSRLHIYRRHMITTSTVSPYYGMGRWERVNANTTPVSGNISLNLRGPIHYKEFYNTFQPVASPMAGYSISTGIPLTAELIKANVFLHNGTKQIVSAEEEGQEFLFVVEQTGNVFPGVGSFIRTQRATGGVDTNQLSPARYQVLPYGYETPTSTSGILYQGRFQSTYYNGQSINRNLNEAYQTTLTSNTVGFSDSIPYSSNGGMAPSISRAAISKFVTYPTTDFGANISPAII